MDRDVLQSRKRDHLRLAQSEAVETPHGDPLFGCVRFVHDALPELAMADVDLSATVAGRPLRAPLVISGMTGGTEESRRINLELAAAAEAEGIGFGVGSMRAALIDPSLMGTYDVRPLRPALLMANIGASQLTARPGAARTLLEAIGADAICIHLNVAHELAQPEGDRDFRGCLEAIAAAVGVLGHRVVVKETGCGMGPAVVRRLAAVGVRAFDVAGAGGTCFPRVEALRGGGRRSLGWLLDGWGLPTAACVAGAARVLRARRNRATSLIASGGVRSGLDVARAIALGADAASLGLPVLRALHVGGAERVRALLREVIEGLRAACLLVGARDLAALRRAPLVILEPLRSWLAQIPTGAAGGGRRRRGAGGPPLPGRRPSARPGPPRRRPTA